MIIELSKICVELGLTWFCLMLLWDCWWRWVRRPGLTFLLNLDRRVFRFIGLSCLRLPSGHAPSKSTRGCFCIHDRLLGVFILRGRAGVLLPPFFTLYLPFWHCLCRSLLFPLPVLNYELSHIISAFWGRGFVGFWRRHLIRCGSWNLLSRFRTRSYGFKLIPF